MTLAICMVSKDSDIVVASDSQITLGPVRRTESKIKKIGTSTLWVASGDVVFINRVAQWIDRLPNEIKEGGLLRLHSPLINMLTELQIEAANCWKSMHRASEWEEASWRADGCELLFADILEGPKILRINKCRHDDLLGNHSFEAIGQAAPFANAVLEGYDDKNMSLEGAMITIYCVIQRAISVGLYNLCAPINIWVIRKFGKRAKAYRLTRSEVKALRAASSAQLATDSELCLRLFDKQGLTSPLLKNIGH